MGSQLAMPLFIGKSIDAMNRNDLEAVGSLTLILSGITIFCGFASAMKTYLFQVLSARIARNLRYDFFESMLKKDVSFYDERKSGDLCSRLSSDVQVVQTTLTLTLQQFVQSALFIIIVLILLFFQSWTMTLSLFAAIIPICITAVVVGKKMRKLNEAR
jgi:ABC-type bacteriocin/lantibiotic exporter with double-glycine peptidase domain